MDRAWILAKEPLQETEQDLNCKDTLTMLGRPWTEFSGRGHTSAGVFSRGCPHVSSRMKRVPGALTASMENCPAGRNVHCGTRAATSPSLQRPSAPFHLTFLGYGAFTRD